MTDYNYFRYSNAMVLAPLLAVLTIWTVYLIELRLQVNFNDYGVFPRKASGLKGVVFSPFIHGSLEHLYNNTVPLAVLTTALFYFYRKIAVKVLFWGVLLSGLLTWIIGRPSFHIGASGVIYVLASFIFFKGIFAKYYRLVALSLGVVFLYGSMLWYIFPVEKGISWEGHLAGFLTGLLFALLFKIDLPKEKKYAWEHEDYNEEDDIFLQHFDEDGNFIGSNPAEDDHDSEQTLRINYEFKRKEEG